jgi:plasminogen activator inhibitor 1 RNA-binding protein
VEEAKEMSLEEYEAILAERKAELNKARQARTIDTSEFANLKILNKDEEEQENPLEVSTSREKKGPRAKERKEVQTVEVGFKVGDTTAGERRGRGDRGGRGGRGGGRGFGGGRGGDRPERPERPYSGERAGRGGRGSTAINVEDTSAFPSLG